MNTIIWLIGILGAFCFAINLLPQVVKTYREKSAKDISTMFIYLAYGGNIFSAAFVIYTNIESGFYQVPLYFNYGIALTFTIILHILKRRYR